MANKSKKILSEISAGELLDKITILEIKLDKITDENHLSEINKEYELLNKAKTLNINLTKDLEDLVLELKITNLTLWGIEDKIRICEKNKEFEKEFIKLARAVYATNDKRSQIKSQINEMLGSNIKEIKQYVDY
jgi:hypothetical protein